MKNNTKFVITNIVKDSLYSIKYECSDDEFSSFFNKLQDIEFLFNFFSNNENDLKRGFFGKFNYNIENAISCTIDESEELEDLILVCQPLNSFANILVLFFLFARQILQA